MHIGWIIALIVVLALVARVFWCVRRAPNLIIGKPDSAYMNRWYVLPRNAIFNIYLHEILRSDDDRALHDHPWLNLSIVLMGGYWEVLPLMPPSAAVPLPETIRLWRGPLSFVCRRPTTAHRLEVEPGRSCWSLFITGPKVREWGFWCPQGWRHWEAFVDPTNSGAIGPGCGDA